MTILNYLILMLISLGSFLLFSVQPFLGKALLPVYGGVTSTWITCLLFFQSLLFFGYFYSYLLTNILSTRWQKIVHFLVVLASLSQIPIYFEFITLPSPVFSILQTLTFCILAPYFILSTNVSILQTWLSKDSHEQKNLAYIYGLSNFASFTALLAFPFLVEPYLGVKAQSIYWGYLYMGYAIGVSLIIFFTFNSNRTKTKDIDFLDGYNGKSAFNFNWIILSFLGNALLISGTTNLTQNIASIPFLWILPLTAYLLSFVVAFSLPKSSSKIFWLSIFLISTSFLKKTSFFSSDHHLFLQISNNILLIFSGCMLLHGDLYRIKPGNSKLALFYFTISAGGIIACLLVGIAPSILFDNFYELELTLLLIVFYFLNQKLTEDRIFEDKKTLFFAVKTIFILFGIFIVIRISNNDLEISKRNFFGVVKISSKTEFGKNLKIMQHGSIVHGMQYLEPDLSNQPTTYYCSDSLIGKLLSFPRTTPWHAGIVGLGVGTLSSYFSREDKISFFEINPQVIELAQKYFSFLSQSKAQIEFVEGDARKTLERQNSLFNILVIDAFNGDAIPVHLLTKEALKLYFDHLNSDGILVLHISNLYLDIKKMLKALSEDQNYSAYYLGTKEDKSEQCSQAEYALITKHGYDLKNVLAESDIKLLKNLKELPSTAHAWTDDYSNFLEIAR